MRPLDFIPFIAILFGSIMAPEAWSYDPKDWDRARANERPQELDGLGIEEQLGKSVSLELELLDETGGVVRLGDFFKEGRPVVLSLVYYTCPSLCNLHLNGLMEGLGGVRFRPGLDYELVVVSFEPEDTPEVAAAKKQSYLEAYGLVEHGDGVHFLLGAQGSIDELTKSVGFSYAWDEASVQWAHSSAAIFLSPEGKISRYLHGIVFEERNLRLALTESAEGRVGDFIDQVMLFCFNYDPEENKYALAAFRVMRTGGALMIVALFLWLLPFWLKSRRKSNAVQGVA